MYKILYNTENVKEKISHACVYIIYPLHSVKINIYTKIQKINPNKQIYTKESIIVHGTLLQMLTTNKYQHNCTTKQLIYEWFAPKWHYYSHFMLTHSYWILYYTNTQVICCKLCILQHNYCICLNIHRNLTYKNIII